MNPLIAFVLACIFVGLGITSYLSNGWFDILTIFSGVTALLYFIVAVNEIRKRSRKRLSIDICVADHLQTCDECDKITDCILYQELKRRNP